tara:strand:- start:2213 stop:3856 length:1644 start_codon:yes stop_codon:yes gene_type:complete
MSGISSTNQTGLLENLPELRATMEENLRQFEALSTQAEDLYAKGNLNAAAVYALLAAWIAAHSHCGLFASARLERLLTAIGRQAQGEEGPPGRNADRPERFERVLHVASDVRNLGGLANMLRRWIESDPSRTHSLAITHQSGRVLEGLTEAVAKAGGEIIYVNREAGGIIGSARALRRAALKNDIVVLHTANSDVIPSIAFAQPDRFPPVFFLNHSDHMFWLGSAISHVVGSMRQAALDIATERRGIAPERSLLVPILATPPSRSTERAKAKEKLGLAADEILMISVARAQKFRTLEGLTYADVHVPLLRDRPNARLVIVGGGERPDWDDASAQVGGRIQSLEPQDPKPWFEAADIYVDSFPFCSATSMMEAASYAIPCVSRFLWPDSARISGMDHPGLAGPMLEGRTNDEYLALIRSLIDSPDTRKQSGDAILQSVKRSNATPGWNRHMEDAMDAAMHLPPAEPDQVCGNLLHEVPNMGEPDVRLQSLYGFSPPFMDLLRGHLTLLPLGERLRAWRRVYRAGGFKNAGIALKHLAPEWAIRRIKDR